MFSSRNIHFAFLGVILGATSGYVLAFYQVQRNAPATLTSSSASTGGSAPAGHPEVTDEEGIALFKEAIERNPDQPALMARYANFLFDRRKFGEAAEWYRKVLAIQPDNRIVRTDMGTALWNMGDTKGATAEYERAHQLDPNHLPTLHSLVVALVEGNGDLQRAAELLKRLEEIDPNQSTVPSLQAKLQDRQRRAKAAQ